MKKFKKIIFLACFVMLIAVMAIAVSASSAYDPTRTVDVDLTKLPTGTKKVGDEVLTGDSVTLPLYQKNEDGTYDALTWYIVTTTESDDTTEGTAGTTSTTVITLVSIKTKKIAYVTNDNNKYLRLYKTGETDPYGNADTVITPGDIVVLNFQDDTINALNGAENNAGTGVQIKSSTSLQYIYFSDSTKSFLSKQLFSGCKNLKGVYFGENSKLTAFSNKTFENCTSLTEVVLPPNLKDPSSAFMGCTGLKTISLPASVTTLWYTFSGCTSLEEVIFAEGSNLTIIDQQAFENCSKLTSLNIPNSVTKIGYKTFFGCTSLSGAISLNSVTEIGEQAFNSCTGLTELTLPNIKTIVQYAFKGCSGLTTVSIPSSVIESLGNQVFMDCSSLKKVTFADSSSLKTLSNQTFENCGSLESINIPNGVTTIGSRAFYGCSALASINIPDGVTEIGEIAFRSCTSLTELTLPNIKTIGNYAFKGCSGLTMVSIPSSALESLGNQVFMDCSSLKKVTFADSSSLETLSDSTFENCNSLESISLPNGITKIGARAFYNCKALASITLPNRVTTIGQRAFTNCSALEYVNLGASVTTFETDGTNCNAFYGCSGLKTFIMPATIVLKGTEKQLFHNASKTIKFFFTGTKDQVDTLQAALTTATNNTPFTNISGDNIVKYDSATDYTSLSGAYIIYDYNKCEAFYRGKHIESDAVLAYADGFDKSGTSTCTCIRECGYSKSTAIAPIFAALGYSIKGTNDAIYGGFTVNAEALKNYNDYITAQGENALRYGIVIVNMGTTVATDANLAFGTDGIVSNEKAIQVEIKDTTFTRFGFTLTGFGDTTKGLNLVISAYVIESKTDAETDTTTVKNVSFVQQEAKNVDGTGIDGYYTAMVIANSSETKKLGTMTLTRLLALTGKGVVTEDTTVAEATNGESASGGGTEVIE